MVLRLVLFVRLTAVWLAGIPAVVGQVPAAAGLGPQAPDWSLPYASAIITARLRQHLGVLASDAYEGRETGEKGQKMAAEYIQAQFRALGLIAPVPGTDNGLQSSAARQNSPPPTDFMQRFDVERSVWATAQMKLQVGTRTYTWLKDFYSSGDSPFRQETALRPVFVGYGIEQEGYSDYAGLDVKGRDLIILLGEPLTPAGEPRFGSATQPSKWTQNSVAKLTLATEKGARSVFFIYSEEARFAASLVKFRPYIEKGRMTLPDATASASAPRTASFLVTPAVGLALLGTTAKGLRRYQAATTAAGHPIASPFAPAQVRLCAPRVRQLVSTENVLGYVEGSDKKDEVVVISAHYDHLGVFNGAVYHGADDNGSGTAALLALAQAFAEAQKAGHGPRRSLLFLAFTGEEKGLLGSDYYTRHPAVPLAQTLAVLNIDMIGRSDDEPVGNALDVVGSNKLSSDLHALSEAANQRYTHLTLNYRYNAPDDPEQVYYRSDHYPFAQHRIPAIFYTTGDHADYHQPTDDVDKIDFPLLARRTQLVFHTAWELANREQRLVVDSARP